MESIPLAVQDLRDELERRGMTQRDLLRRLPKVDRPTPSALSRWLSGQRAIDVRTLSRLAKALDCEFRLRSARV